MNRLLSVLLNSSPLLESVSTKIRANITSSLAARWSSVNCFSFVFTQCVCVSGWQNITKESFFVWTLGTTSPRDLLGTMLAYKSWLFFFNLLTYSLTSTYAHSKTETTQSWDKNWQLHAHLKLLEFRRNECLRQMSDLGWFYPKLVKTRVKLPKIWHLPQNSHQNKFDFDEFWLIFDEGVARTGMRLQNV